METVETPLDPPLIEVTIRRDLHGCIETKGGLLHVVNLL